MQQEIVNKSAGNVKTIVNHFQNIHDAPTSQPDISVYGSCKDSSASMSSLASDCSNITLPKTAFAIANLTSAPPSLPPVDHFQRPPPPAAEEDGLDKVMKSRRSRGRQNRNERVGENSRSRSRSTASDSRKLMKAIDPPQNQNGPKK